MIHLQKISYPLSNLASNISDRDNLMDTSNEIKYLMKQDPDNIKIIKHEKTDARDIHIMCNKSVEVVFFFIYSILFDYNKLSIISPSYILKKNYFT